MMPHFRDRRGAALLRYRNQAKINILICEQKLYSVWFFEPAQKLTAVQFDAAVRSDDMVYSVSYKTVPRLKTTNNIIHLYAQFSHSNFLKNDDQPKEARNRGQLSHRLTMRM